MVVQHNLTAMNSNRMLGITTGAQAKSTEKLSSGYKINRAADDAAGLSISEKMRKQINGLDRASTNAEDGVSAVQTAEGALTEVHSMLQRMNELAVQAANGTNSEDDREAIQNEIDQLSTEIDRVAETTKFNETYLLKGEAAGGTKTDYVAAHDAGLKGKLGESADGKTTFTLDKALANGDKVTIAGKEYTIGNPGTTGTVIDEENLNTSVDGYATTTALGAKILKAGDSVTLDGKTYTMTDHVGVGNLVAANFATNDTFTIGDKTITVVASYTAQATDNATGKYTAADALTLVQTEVAKGNQVVKGGNTIVSKLETGEVSMSTLTGNKDVDELATNLTTTVKAGDSLTQTVNGKTETTVATDNTPTSAKAVYDAINALAKNATVTIGSGTSAKVYTVVDEADVDETSYKMTKEAILAKIKDGDTVKVAGNTYTVIGDIGGSGEAGDVISTKQAYEMMAKELTSASSIGTDAGKGATVESDGKGGFTITQGTVETKKSLNFSLHVGADADMTNKISVGIDAMDTASLGIKGLNVKDDTGVAATYAIDAIADAVAKVSAQRSALGAVQNRLEHTIANLDNVVENTTSAESRIRDTDMAEEMVEYSKNNILAQAGQSMLAQANQSTQGVLSLLG